MEDRDNREAIRLFIITQELVFEGIPHLTI